MRVIPRAATSQIAGTRGGALLVRLAAPPAAGAANDALITLLASTLGVPRRAVRLTAGERSRHKQVAIDGRTPTEIRERLSAWLRA